MLNDLNVNITQKVEAYPSTFLIEPQLHSSFLRSEIRIIMKVQSKNMISVVLIF